MTREKNILKKQRIARLSLARSKAKDPDMKRIWGNKIDELKHYGDDPKWREHWSGVFKKMR
tara:strand:- start:574 stop:756 length:183 start_codon:yes stop_codon:yes gene_type:complete